MNRYQVDNLQKYTRSFSTLCKSPTHSFAATTQSLLEQQQAGNMSFEKAVIVSRLGNKLEWWQNTEINPA